jgi:hypothetical protein
MATLEINRVVVVGRLPVRLGHREQNLGRDGAGITAPGLEVEGPGALSEAARRVFSST